MELSKSEYISFVKDLKKFWPQYVEQVETSLVIDEAVYKMGFMKEPLYTFDLNIDIHDFNDLSNKMEIAHQDSFSNGVFDDEKYSEFDDYINFYNTIKLLKSNKK